MKLALALAVLAAIAAAPATALRDDRVTESFKERMKELMEASKKMEEMLNAETRSEQKSWEEIEEMFEEDSADMDASVSKESEPVNPSRDGGDDGDDDMSGIEEIFGRHIPGGGLFNFFSFGGGATKPWFSGPNVCTTREEKTDNSSASVERGGDRNSGFVMLGSAQFSTCKHSSRKYTCTTISKNNGVTKTVTVVYECCHGYGRVAGKEGCQKVETKPTLELISDIGANKFVSLIRSTSLERNFETENRTVFVPTDTALEQYEAESNQVDTTGNAKAVETNDVMDMVGSVADERQLVLNHIVSGLIDTSDFRNDLVLKSESGGVLRLNYFPGRETPVVTVNCARLNATDNISTNAVVHTVDGVLTPVTKTVQQILEQPEYSKFKAMLEEYGLWNNISSPDGSFTVLAVNNMAFENGARFENSNCVQKILKHHILEHTVCSHAASSGQLSALDLAHTWLALELASDTEGGGRRLVFDSEVAAAEGRTDMMATNGVVHEVPDFVVPASAKSVIEVLKSTNATRMVGYLDKAGLISEAVTTPKLTLFVPSEEYLEDKREVLDAMDVVELRSLLRRHMATDPRGDGEGGDDGCEVADSGLQVTNKNGRKLSIRTAKNVLSSFIGTPGKTTVECVPLLRFNGKACNGVMHEISGFIPDPNMTVYDIVQNRQDLRVLKRLLADTKLESELKGATAGVTVLAPVDRAFEKMGRRNFEVLAADKDMADQVLRNHIIPEVICCWSIGTTSWPFTQSVKTMGMGRVMVNGASAQRGAGAGHGRRSAAAVFSGARTDKCDIVANNGVVHTVDSVILPAEFRGNSEVIIRRPYSDIILAGF